MTYEQLLKKYFVNSDFMYSDKSMIKVIGIDIPCNKIVYKCYPYSGNTEMCTIEHTRNLIFFIECVFLEKSIKRIPKNSHE